MVITSVDNAFSILIVRCRCTAAVRTLRYLYTATVTRITLSVATPDTDRIVVTVAADAGGKAFVGIACGQVLTARRVWSGTDTGVVGGIAGLQIAALCVTGTLHATGTATRVGLPV